MLSSRCPSSGQWEEMAEGQRRALAAGEMFADYAFLLRDFAKVSNATASTMMMPQEPLPKTNNREDFWERIRGGGG
jgi:hypothetical protein